MNTLIYGVNINSFFSKPGHKTMDTLMLKYAFVCLKYLSNVTKVCFEKASNFLLNFL